MPSNTSEALKKENVKENLWEGAAVDQAVFAIQLSILNRMSFLAGFAELGEAGRPYGSRSNTHMGGLQPGPCPLYLPTKSKSLTFSRSNSMEKPLSLTISMNA